MKRLVSLVSLLDLKKEKILKLEMIKSCGITKWPFNLYKSFDFKSVAICMK